MIVFIYSENFRSIYALFFINTRISTMFVYVPYIMAYTVYNNT